MLKQKIEDMRKLEKGWNGYKADPPSTEAIQLAEKFTVLLPDYERFNPSAMGGVAITYQNGRRVAYLEFYNNGEHALMLEDGINVNVLSNLSFEDAGITIQDYLNAHEDLDFH